MYLFKTHKYYGDKTMKITDTQSVEIEIQRTRLQVYKMLAGWLSITYILGIGFAVYEIYKLIF